MKVHMAGKNGDLIYALPVIKALARKNGKVTLMTSALCYQLVPILWEQPYLADVEMDYERSYRIDDRGSMEPWAVLGPDEGINLSPQPAIYRPNAPVPWTMAYAELAGVEELTAKDKVALPSLWNHRQWYWEHEVKREDSVWEPPPTAVLAPESETLKTIPLWLWKKVANALIPYFKVIIVGTRRDNSFEGVTDMRGLTTVSTIARILAETHVAICANSLPWHLARHAGTPTFCFQDQYLERCIPVDMPSRFYSSENWNKMIEHAIELSPSRSPRTTLLDNNFLKQIKEI